jgi:hypothetical protein
MTANLSPFSFTPLDLVRDLPVHSNLRSGTTLPIRSEKAIISAFSALFRFGFLARSFVHFFPLVSFRRDSNVGQVEDAAEEHSRSEMVTARPHLTIFRQSKFALARRVTTYAAVMSVFRGPFL